MRAARHGRPDDALTAGERTQSPAIVPRAMPLEKTDMAHEDLFEPESPTMGDNSSGLAINGALPHGLVVRLGRSSGRGRSRRSRSGRSRGRSWRWRGLGGGDDGAHDPIFFSLHNLSLR